MDRSTVTYEYQHGSDADTYNCQDSPLIHMATDNTSLLIYCIFVLSNILLSSLTMLYFRKMLIWIQQQPMKILYKSVAIVLTFANIILIAADLAFTITNYLHFDLNLLFFKVPLVILILILEIPAVCYHAHRFSQNNANNMLYTIAHAFALC